jgi:NADP-reducing hydrogenase subunit HndB
MAKLASLQDLTELRQSLQADARRRAQTGVAISIGMGTCGIAAGARETMSAIQSELARQQIDAQIASVGCIGICAKEPLVDIQVAGKSRVMYANVTADMVPKLIEQHLVRGEPVVEWVVCRMPGE